MTDSIKTLRAALAAAQREEARAQKAVERLKAQRDALDRKIDLADSFRQQRAREVWRAQSAVMIAEQQQAKAGAA